MPSYRITRKAQSDVRQIGLYTEREWGRPQRRRYLAGLEAKFKFLAAHPLLFAERPELTPPVRISGSVAKTVELEGACAGAAVMP